MTFRFLRARLLSVWRILPLAALLAYPQLATAQSVETDLPYVAGGGHKQQLDFYRPEQKNFPVVLLVHGGSLREGDRKESPFPEICRAFQSARIGCANMSYRLRSDALWPAPARDVAAAFAWLKKNAASRSGDPGRIFLVGHSSGAHMVALVSSDPQYLKEQGYSTRDIAGTVPIGSIMTNVLVERMEQALQSDPERVAARFQTDEYLHYFGTPEAYRNAWPMYHVGAHLPPFLFLVAEAEQEKPPVLSTNEEFARRARQHGVSVAIRVLPDRTHYSTIEKMVNPDDSTTRLIVEFVQNRK